MDIRKKESEIVMDGVWGTEEAIRRWDKHAKELTSKYTSEGDPSREVLLNPVLFELMGNVKDKRVLDAGCGEGYLSRMMAKDGASVVAVDYSQKMLDIAEERTPEKLNIDYKYSNFEDLGFLKDESFDIIVSNMVLQDLQAYETAISEAYRLLDPNGLFIFSISHPCFSTPESGWVRNEEGKKKYWKVDKYFYEGVYQQAYPLGVDDGVLIFHRTLTSYFRTVLAVGFAVEALVEPSPKDEKLDKYPGFIDDFRMCHFMVFKVRKAKHNEVN